MLDDVTEFSMFALQFFVLSLQSFNHFGYTVNILPHASYQPIIYKQLQMIFSQKLHQVSYVTTGKKKNKVV